MKFWYALLVAGVIFLVIDAIWLKAMAPIYRKHLGSLLRDKPHMGAAVLFYVLYIIGLTVLVLLPTLENANWLEVGLLGALFGAVAYGAYDLTNQSTLKGWSWFITSVDILWGAFLTGAVSLLTIWIVG